MRTLTVALTLHESRDIVSVLLDVLYVALNLLVESALALISVGDPCLTALLFFTCCLAFGRRTGRDLAQDGALVNDELSIFDGTLVEFSGF